MRLLGSQLTLHKLQVLYAVAETGSISRAAEALGIAQPAVTAHMRAIQEKLGVRLVVKRGRNIEITEEGRVAYRWARDIVLRTRELERELQEGPKALRGRVVIAASLTVGGYVLPETLAELRKNSPGIEIRLKVTPPIECLAALKAGECDLVVAHLDPGQNVDGLEIVRLWEEKLLLVSARHSSLVGARVEISGVADLPFVIAERGTPRHGVEEVALRPFGIVRQRIAIEIGHPEGIKQAVAADCGVAFIFAASIRKNLEQRTLRVVETPGLDISVPIYLIKRQDRVLSPAQEKVRAFLQRELMSPAMHDSSPTARKSSRVSARAAP